MVGMKKLNFTLEDTQGLGIVQQVFYIEVYSLESVYDFIAELLEGNYIVQQIVTNKKHSMERGDIIEVIITTIYKDIKGGLDI